MAKTHNNLLHAENYPLRYQFSGEQSVIALSECPLCDQDHSRTSASRLDRKRTFGQGLKAKHSHFIQYDWRSKLQTLDDYVAEIAMLG